MSGGSGLGDIVDGDILDDVGELFLGVLQKLREPRSLSFRALYISDVASSWKSLRLSAVSDGPGGGASIAVDSVCHLHPKIDLVVHVIALVEHLA